MTSGETAPSAGLRETEPIHNQGLLNVFGKVVLAVRSKRNLPPPRSMKFTTYKLFSCIIAREVLLKCLYGFE